MIKGILKVNRNHLVPLDNIKKFVDKGDTVWVYLKKGYPPILKTDYNFYQLRLKLNNLRCKITDFIIEEDK